MTSPQLGRAELTCGCCPVESYSTDSVGCALQGEAHRTGRHRHDVCAYPTCRRSDPTAGVPHRLIDALMSYADFEAPVGGGCTVLRMTRDRLDVPDLTDRLGADVTP